MASIASPSAASRPARSPSPVSTPMSQKTVSPAATSTRSSAGDRRAAAGKIERFVIPPTPSPTRQSPVRSPLTPAVQSLARASPKRSFQVLQSPLTNSTGSHAVPSTPQGRTPVSSGQASSHEGSPVRRSPRLAENEARLRARLSTNTKSTSLKAFASWLDGVVAKHFGGWDLLDKDKDVLKGNSVLKPEFVGLETYKFAKQSVERAQYGRALYSFVDQALKAVGIKPEDSVVDIGSGIGTVVLQAAATFGCRQALGIELCLPRHNVALKLQPMFAEFSDECNADWSERIEFKQGDFRIIDNFQRCREADVLFVNNAESVFQARSVKLGEATLDWHVARAFAGMKVGSRVACFDPLLDLEVKGIASCFERRDHESESGATSWTKVSGKRTHFVSYRKISDTWKCERCSTENPLLRPSRNVWGETFQDICKGCASDPSGMKKTYATRQRKAKSGT